MAQADPSRSTGRDTGTNPAEGFGLFKVNLAKHLDFPMIQQLSILLVLEHGEIESIKRSETPGLEIVNLLDERGIITPTDIRDLLKMLDKLELAGLAARIQISFQTKTSQAKKDQDLYLEGFARFKVDLAEHLDFPTIHRLSTLLGLKPGEIDSIKRSKTPGLEMVNLLDNQGFITPSDITEFLKKLKELGLARLTAKIQESFQAKTSQAKKDQDLYLEGFGLFKVDLANHLNATTIQRLSILLGLKPGEIDSIKRSKTSGLEMVKLLDERGFITPTGIGDLLKMLRKLKLDGLAARIRCSFQARTSQAKKDQDLEGASSAASSINVKETLNSINPHHHQYVSRFACGLGKVAAYFILKQMQISHVGYRLPMLCMFEQEEKSVKDSGLSTRSINSCEDKLSQRSTIQVLEDASAKQIPISCVYLNGCSPRVDDSGLNLILQSGVSLSILRSLRELLIYDKNRRLINEELAAILSYCSQCTSLKELMFQCYHLPDTIPVGSIPSSLKSRKVKVWNRRIPVCHLNLQTGRWQLCDIRGNLPGEEGFDEETYQWSLVKFNRARRK